MMASMASPDPDALPAAAGSRPKDRRAIVVGGVLLLVAAVIAVVSLRSPDGQSEGQTVRVKRVVRGELVSRVRAQGRVRARQQARVGSELAGRVVAVFVQEGEDVAVGDPLFALDDEQAKNAVAQLQVALRSADAMVRRAELVVAEARRNLERDEMLNKRGAIPKEQVATTRARLELSQADIDTARASVDRTRLDLSRARDALKKTRVTAPLAGTVVDVGLEVGQVVAPMSAGFSGGSSTAALTGGGIGGGASLTSEIVIADLRELVAELEVDELDIARVRVGQEVRLRVQGSLDEDLDGTIERSGLFGREAGGAVVFDVVAAIDQGRTDGGPHKLPTEGPPSTSSLRPGMSVAAEIEVQTLPDAVLVPMAAVLEAAPGKTGAGTGDRVFVVEDDGPQKIARERTIVIGPSERDLVSVMTGLSVGDLLIEGPYRALRELKEGDPVLVEGDIEDVRAQPGPGGAGR